MSKSLYVHLKMLHIGCYIDINIAGVGYIRHFSFLNCEHWLLYIVWINKKNHIKHILI